MNIETKLLEDFLSLSQTRSFSRSAELRYVTQPAFSRRIKQLERVLGVLLINREVSPVELTLAGQHFVPCARNAIEQLKESVNYIRSIQNDHIQPASFASTHVLSLSYFPKIAHYLESSVSQFNSKLTIVDAYDSSHLLSNGLCDFLLGFSDYKVNLNNIDKIQLGGVKLLPVCKPAYDGTPMFSLDSTNHEVPILDYAKNIYFGHKVSDICKRNANTVKLRPLIESSMADTLRALAISGLGVTWIPSSNIEHELKNSQLVICGDEKWQADLDVVIFRDSKTKEKNKEQIWSKLVELGENRTSTPYAESNSQNYPMYA